MRNWLCISNDHFFLFDKLYRKHRIKFPSANPKIPQYFNQSIQGGSMSKIQIPQTFIEKRIYLIRGKKVMLDRDLAELYNVPVKVLNQAVHRNIDRFPKDFMFQLSTEEMESLRSHFVTLKRGQHSKYLRNAFTENGVAMLSSVLRSKRAVQVNVMIMRTFTKMREIASSHTVLKQKIEELEKSYNKQFRVVFMAIKELFSKFDEPIQKKRKIGFHADE